MSDQDIRFRIVVEENAGPAAQRTEQAFQRVAGSATAASGQTAAAMRMLPAQLSDVATQLAGGQSPFLVLMQQGLQTRDMFGSFRAMAAGIGSALTPMALGLGGAAAALALVGTAMVSAEREARKLQDMLTLTGNAAGLTADRLRDMSQRVAAGSRASASEAREVVTALAAEGTVSARVLESMAVAAQRVADLSGRSAQDVARDFARMAGGVAEWAAEHNKAWNFLTLEQYRYIKRLEEQGKAEEAAIYVSRQLAGQFEAQSKNLGYLENAWKKAGEAAQWAWGAMMGLGREKTTAERIEIVKRQLAEFDANMPTGSNAMVDSERLAAIRAQREQLATQLAALQRDQATENRLADERSAAAKRERDGIQADRDKPKPASNGPSAADRALAERMALAQRAYAGMSGADLARDDFRRSELSGTDRVNEALRDGNAKMLAEQQKLREQEAKRLQEADAKRLEGQQKMLADLVRANEDANLQLIADDEARALAQVTLERSRLQQQIEQVYGSSEARAAAEAAADAAADARRRGVAQRFARDTALITREETRDALARAFQDSRNPIRAFGDALGNIVFQRVSTKLADAILQSSSLDFIGRAGSFLGDLVGSFLGGGSGGNLTDMGVNGEVAFARGGIVNRATAFKFFAKGGALQNGIMGEAGPEAIMPLRRGPDGSLGVMAAGGLGQPTQVHLQVINNTGTAVKSSVSQGSDGSIRLMLDAVDEEMASRIGNGQGATVQALQARFNLRPSLG